MRKKLKSLIRQRHSDIIDTTKFQSAYELPITTKEALEKLEMDYKTHKDVKETYVRCINILYDKFSVCFSSLLRRWRKVYNILKTKFSTRLLSEASSRAESRKYFAAK